jgi:hypothetical protein
VESYLGRVSKERILEAVRESVPLGGKMKKGTYGRRRRAIACRQELVARNK